MLRVLSKTPAALRGTPAVPKNAPFVGNQIPPPESVFDSPATLAYFVILCIGVIEQLPKHTEFLTFFLNYYVTELNNMLLTNIKFHTRMMVVLRNNPTGHLVLEYLKLRVKQYIEILKNDDERQSKKIGVLLHRNFGIFRVEDNHSVDIRPREGGNDFQDLFDTIWLETFPHHSVQEHQEMEYFSSLLPKVWFSDVVEVHSYPPPPEAPRSSAEIVAQNAVTFTAELQPVVPELVSVPQPSDTPPVDESVEIVRVLPDSPSRDDATVLFLPVVKSVLADCVAKVIIKSTEAIGARNQAVLSHILNEEIDAKVLRHEVASRDTKDESAAITDASAALEAAELVKVAVDAGKSIFVDSPPASPGIQSLERSNEDLRNIFRAQIELEVKSLPTGFAESVNDVAGRIASILEEIQNSMSSSSSPLPPNCEVQAHFTNSAQSLSQGVEDGALGAQQPLFSSTDLEISIDAPKSSSSNPSSGLSGTPPTHEPLSMLLAASMPSSPQTSFTPAAVTSADSGILAQSSSNPLKPAPPLPLKTPRVITKMNGGGAQSSGIPIGNPPGNAQSIVGGSGNPPANLPSSASQGKVGGPPVQVLAQSVDPSGDSSGADQPKTQSRLNLLSSCIPGRKSSSASQCQQASQSRGWRCNFFQSGKSNRVNPSHGETGNTRPPVAHSSVDPSECAATTPPLSQTVVLPAGRTGIGGSGSSQDGTDRSAFLHPPNSFGTNDKPVRPLPPIPVIPFSRGTDIRGSLPAHSPGDPPELVPPSAPSSSSALESAATPAADPLNEKPPTSWGVKIVGIERDVVRSPFDDIATVLLNMKYSKAPPLPPPQWTHPCVPNVPLKMARQARVA